LKDSVIHNSVAIVRDFENEWVFDIQPHHPGYTYMRQVKNYYRCLFDRQLGTDIISPKAEFHSYSMLIVPHMAIVTEAFVEKIYRFVQEGGIAVFDFRSGIKWPDNRMRSEMAPGPLKELLGIQIDDYGIITEEDPQNVRFDADSESYQARIWFDVIETLGAEPIASFQSDYYAGRPAVTGNPYGKGKAYYIGTELEPEALRRLMDRICQEGSIAPEWSADHPGVEVAVRRQGGKKRYFAARRKHGSADESTAAGTDGACRGRCPCFCARERGLNRQCPIKADFENT
jgi:beta-galactosidase